MAQAVAARLIAELDHATLRRSRRGACVWLLLGQWPGDRELFFQRGRGEARRTVSKQEPPMGAASRLGSACATGGLDDVFVPPSEQRATLDTVSLSASSLSRGGCLLRLQVSRFGGPTSDSSHGYTSCFFPPNPPLEAGHDWTVGVGRAFAAMAKV